MTDRDLSQDPGAPEVTDPEATSAEAAEAAEAEAERAAGAEDPAGAGAAEDNPGFTVSDPEADAAVNETLGEADEAAAADAGADAAVADNQDSLETQLAERTEDLQRVTAEYTNYRRRVERDRVATIDGAKADVAAQLLPILDDLDLAESHGDLTGPLKATADKLQAVMRSMKVEAFGAEGDEFNPDHHEAVQDMSSGDDKVVGTVLRKGYRLGDRVLRNAMIVIEDPA
ncbi:MAG TPA: nucleotide exchange factor GrpE [Candidatus Corynebacterium gallistercoris]|uniref:Protein GrpE n=1 Tax=Candidatus Corynebacterium gallistercoris TaxID=2838530 RepID=A0A9D1RZ03_9CORY|nr:nucleotide exchange factor GrpE [Candidatus Corynebacterium gallistercoris]